MKIDRSRIKKSTSEIPAECQGLIEKLRSCSSKELLDELKKIDTWTFGKCELYHWIEILDLCDSILEVAAAKVRPDSWQIQCDLPENAQSKELLLWILHFTTLLIEHSFSRHLYNSVEHLLTLLSSCDLNVVLGVLNLLYMFSKRSNFITRINPEMRNSLLKCLTYLAESWGGKENGFGLADCTKEDSYFPASATTLHYEFYTEDASAASQASCIHLEHVDRISHLASEIMDGLVDAFNVPKDGQMLLFSHLRLAHSFSVHSLRLKCVQARLQALSVLLYSNAESHTLLYTGILDELVELLQLNTTNLVEIRSAALRTLTAIIHLDRSPHIPKKPGSRLHLIIDVTGAGLYHGFLPQLVRSCIASLTGGEDRFPIPLATALFSFLYHLASYEAGGEALVTCGMMECLLRVINWPGSTLEHITFVTRAVRVIDLITNIDMQSFQSHGGLNSFINRLAMEMSICRIDQPFEINVESQRQEPRSEIGTEPGTTTEAEDEMVTAIDRVVVDSDSNPSSSKELMQDMSLDKTQVPENCGKPSKTCLPQRAALLKSMLNFLKKALQDPAFTDSIRHVMDGSLPSSLKHIISNAEYYGPSLFLLATDVVAVYVFQEPSLLSSLQDIGLTDVVLHALLVKQVPATREVLGSVPNVFSALCLNTRGLVTFCLHKPFEKLCRVLLSPNYLSAMRRRRSSDPIGDTASNLGNAMDELMRHQPSLKNDAIAAIIKLLHELCQLGRDPKYVCWKPQKGSSGESPNPITRVTNEAGSSDEEEEDEEEASTSSHPQRDDTAVDTNAPAFSEKTPIALVDYILNVMKFVDAILSNNSTDDHCREFVSQNGLVPLMSILGLPNLPVDYPITPAAQAVASVCKSVLNLAHEAQVMKEGLSQLSEVLGRLAPLRQPRETHSSSLLLEELAKAPCMETAFSTPWATPMLHAMAAAHGYAIMFAHVCRTGQMDIRTISMTHWGSELGLSVLHQLAELYIALVWESTVLLSLCSEESTWEYEYLQLICPQSLIKTRDPAEESMDIPLDPMEMDDLFYCCPKLKSLCIPQNTKIKYIKPLLGASSRLGRALAELFGLLVKLCVGFPMRTRRGNHVTSLPVQPTPSAHAVANTLAMLLANSLNCNNLNSLVPKFKLTYLICSVGFTQPMLFDEKRYPYHLMLQKFVRSKGQAAFFDTFKEGLDIDPTGEFLDAWLLLLEKMVNPKAIFDSSHVLSLSPYAAVAPNVKGFNPRTYLQQVHKMAFEALSSLWGKKLHGTYGGRMTETMLTIYRHILRGEKLIEERKQKEDNIVVVNPTTSEQRRTGNTTRERPEVNPVELTQLMDMGFSREHCYEALVLTANLEHATDYLLNNFFPHNVQTSQAPTETEEEEESEPLKKEDLDNFSSTLLKECLEYIEKFPETVYRVCELLTVAIRRNGEEYCYTQLNTIVDQTIEGIHALLQLRCMMLARKGKSPPMTDTEIQDAATACYGFSCRIAANLHLFMLLFEEMRVSCATVVHEKGLLAVLITLLVEASDYMEEGNPTPKWMAPLLLIIDMYEKVSVSVNRKIAMHKVTVATWRWLDLTSGRWSLYMPSNNKLINDAYWRGDRDVTIPSGRRRYTINFSTMCQINDDSGKARPVMMALVDPKDPSDNNYDNPLTDLPPFPNNYFKDPAEKDSNDTEESLSEPEYYVAFFHKRVGLQPMAGISSGQAETILRCCMELIAKPVDSDTLHAVMQLCVRFTRDYKNARIMAEAGAIKQLLKLTQASSFTGFLGLATMLVRHILEEPANITSAIERAIRFKTLPNIPPTYKELHYILRECAPAICRDPEIFKSVATQIMRVDISALNKRTEEEDGRMLMKCLATTEEVKSGNKEVDKLVKRAVTQLLNYLVEAYQEELQQADDPAADSDTASQPAQGAAGSSSEETAATTSNLRSDQDPDVDSFNSSNLPMYIAATGPVSTPSNAQKKTQTTQQSPQQDKQKRLPLLTISNVLRILGDAVRSYSCIAKMVTDHKYSLKQSESANLKEECTAVAFVLDHLMPVRENASKLDSDRPNMARNLLAALASCNHSPDAQCALVTEVKAAMARTLACPESTKKHSHIQDLMGVVTTMIEHCPPVPISSTPLTPALKLNQYSVNNMVKFMMRKGIVTDLARIPHSLDLSSPKMAATINAVLKPLETLSRIMSQPTGGPSSSTKNKPKVGGSSTPVGEEGGPSNTAVTGRDPGVQGSQMDLSGTSTVDIADDDNTDMMDEHPEILNEVMNRVVETVNEMEDIMQNVIERRRLPNLRIERRNRDGQQTRVISEISRFSSLFSGGSDLNTFSTNEETSQDSSSDDSDSNATDEERHTDMDEPVEEDDDDDEDEDDDDEEDDDEEDDDDDDQGGEDNEGDESNEGYDEDGLELFEPHDELFRIPGLDRESDDFLMIEYSEADPSVPMGQPWARDSAFLPLSMFDDTPVLVDSASGSQRVPTHHPLLTARQPVDQPGSSNSRTSRMSRTRRYQYVQMNRAAVAAPVFLQRIMGQNSSDSSNYLNIPGHPGSAFGEMLASTFPNTRLIVMDNGLGILTNSEEEQINFVDQSGYVMGPSLAATLNNVPTSMYWWNEELRLLDRDSVCDCSICVGAELVPIFEQHRNEELVERKEKRKKMEEEEENNKKTSSTNEESDKKTLYEGIMGMFEPTMPQRGGTSSRMPTRRIAMLSAAQEVAQATENLAGSIVESVLQLRGAPGEGAASPSPQEPPAAPSIPEALELIPVAPAPPPSLSDPMGLIPGSVPYQPPADPEDGFYRVNPPQSSNPPTEDETRPRTSPPPPLSMQPTVHILPRDILDVEPLEDGRYRVLSRHLPNSTPLVVGLIDQDPENPIDNASQHQTPLSPIPQPVEPSSTQTLTASEPVPTSQSSFLPDDIPEGVDPSFLAALPEDMRAEVLSEHLRLQRLQNRVQENSQGSEDVPFASQGTSASGLEVNPDFLAALPPAIQEEVLAQQRLEQQRQAAALANPNDPVDAAAFFQDLPHSLRQAILTDMEESQISVLPPELAAEAQNLRREWEARNRQLVQERFLSHVTNSTTALSSILRHSTPRNHTSAQSSSSRRSSTTRRSTEANLHHQAIREILDRFRRPTGPRYTIQNMGQGGRTHWLSSWNLGARIVESDEPSTVYGPASPTMIARPRGRQVLDTESICCLLVLLFVDDSRLNTARLHRVFRNLCYHPATREWVIRALLSIMEKSNESQVQMVGESGEAQQIPGNMRRITRSQSQSSPERAPAPSAASIIASSSSAARVGSSWLNISMDAALGRRATVFHVHKNPGRRNDKSITINPQAAPFVYRHAVEMLISMARLFPAYFVPGKPPSTTTATASPKGSKPPRTDSSNNFWDILIRLDTMGSSKKGKAVTKPSSLPSSDPENLCLESSPYGQLLRMLSTPVVHRSPLLMDKLLRLLSYISTCLQMHRQRVWNKSGMQVDVSETTLQHIGQSINMLTSNTCSEEALGNATDMLLQMTVNLPNTRQTVLNLLLEGTRQMASMVCGHIEQLLQELRMLNSHQTHNDELDDSTVDSRVTSLKGILSNRFTKDTVVVTAPKKVKAGLDLQLSSMAPLISKSSSQAFFLRILKVVVLLRNAVRSFEKKKKKQSDGSSSNSNGGGSGTDEVDPLAPDPETDPLASDSGPEPREPSEPVPVPMDITPQESDAADTLAVPVKPLSEELNLDILWNTLSECLTELQHTQDNHAVLVLQPAVEAFFLVHASGMEKSAPAERDRPSSSDVTERVVRFNPSQGSEVSGGTGGASLPAPVSPLPSDPAQPSTSSATATAAAVPAQSASSTPVPPHQLKFLKFAETHRTVLNQILRQTTTPLLRGPFAVLVNHTRVLDFDVKRRYFRGELERADAGHRREELAVHVRRTQVFEDSFRELHRRPPDEWKNRFYIVFEGEEGQDAGGLLREWYMIISREIFNPMYALFTTSPGDRVTYMINPSSHCNPNHLCYFKFVGRVIAKAIYDNKLLECYFTRSFYKHILGIAVKHTDMESEDYSFYQGLVYLMENHVSSLGYELTFSTEVQEFGVTEVRDLIANGRNIAVTEEGKMEYIRLVCQMKMTGAIRKQLNAFLEGFYDIIPKRLISIFNEQELELLISGLPIVDIEDLKANTEYYKYQPTSLQIQWFWRALREFDQAERAKFLQFVTGTSKVPLQGFAALEGMNGVQKFQIHRDERSTDRLPSAHTCFNQLDLPVYETSTKLRLYLLKAIHECSEGFGFA